MEKVKHINPYRVGTRNHNMFDYIQHSQVITLPELLELGYSRTSINSMLSPRKFSKRGDCRGNPASMGHLYYMEPLPKAHQGDQKRFRLRWRDYALPRRGRPEFIEAQRVALEEYQKEHNKENIFTE